MTPEDQAEIRGMPWKDGPDPELVIRMVDMWNEGYSTNHLVEVLGLECKSDVLKPLGAVRTRTDVPVRRLVQPGQRAGMPEHPSWWTEPRLTLLRALWESGDLAHKMIAKRLKTCEANITDKIRELGWKKARMYAKQRIKRPADEVPVAAKAVLKPVVFAALPGTAPKPFWQVALKGECNFILGDEPGSMADALCCAAETGPGEKYCPAHRKLGVNPLAWGKPKTKGQLVREFVRYA